MTKKNIGTIIIQYEGLLQFSVESNRSIEDIVESYKNNFAARPEDAIKQMSDDDWLVVKVSWVPTDTSKPV